MTIQECYYFNGVGVHWGSVQFLQIIFCCHIYLFVFSFDYWYLLLTVDICIYLIQKIFEMIIIQIIFVYILFKRDTKIKK